MISLGAIIEPIEVYVGILITLVAGVLSGIGLLSYRRERDRRLAVVTLAYTAFTVRGVIVVLVHVFPVVVGGEWIEHISGLLVVFALLAFLGAIRMR